MIYYRLASQKHDSIEWEWKSPAVSSLEALFRLSQRYRTMPAEHMRVFLASSVTYMDVLLMHENRGLPSNSLTLDQLLHHRSGLTVPQIHRFEMELGLSEETTYGENSQVVHVTGQVLGKASALPVIDAVNYKSYGGDHDMPYIFAFPPFLPQVIAWMRLRERLLAGELVL